MITSNHVRIGMLLVSTSVLGTTGCGNTGRDGELSTSSDGTGAAAGTGDGGMAGSGSSSTGQGGGRTTAVTGGAGADSSGGSDGGSTATTGGSAGADSGGGSGGATGGSGGAPATPLYLLSIDHWASPSTLRKIDVTTGVGTEVCKLPAAVDDVNYHSSTFSRNGILYASNANDATIDTIDPCTCAVTLGVPTGFGSLPGITASKSNGLYGIQTSPEDLLVDINLATVVGPLGVDFTTSGATWSDALNNGLGGIYAINGGVNGGDNSLYTIDPVSGAATNPIEITPVNFNSVGIEVHPANGVIYACTNDMFLYSIDPVNGEATKIGPGIDNTTTCNNLAAPWGPIACLDAL
jgi:hypothetical protein